MDLLREVLQPQFNKEVKEILEKYIPVPGVSVAELLDFLQIIGPAGIPPILEGAPYQTTTASRLD